MARLIKTEKEVEGRYETVWTVDDEDVLEQWPAGPLTVVGRDARRIDGLQRARGEARYTADIQLPGRPLLEHVLVDDRPDGLVAALDLLLGLDQARQVAIASSMRG